MPTYSGLYNRIPKPHLNPMFDYLDANIWGLISVPIGLSICFWPALVTWVILELRSPSKESQSPSGPRRKSAPRKKAQ